MEKQPSLLKLKCGQQDHQHHQIVPKMKTMEQILDVKAVTFDKVPSEIRCQHEGNIQANFQTA